MNISYNWLKEYVDFDLTPDEVAAALTSIGLETGSVEEVETIKGGLEGLVIGEVLTCVPHPNSDHMHVTTVNLGNGGEPVQIVCGAPNVAAGQWWWPRWAPNCMTATNVLQSRSQSFAEWSPME